MNIFIRKERIHARETHVTTVDTEYLAVATAGEPSAEGECASHRRSNKDASAT